MNRVFEPLPVEPALVGESPFWHPGERALYWCDIAGRAIHRWRPADGAHRRWDWPAEPGCIAPLAGGGLIAAMRDGLWRIDTDAGTRERLAAPPYDPARERFNDGKADPRGRFWVGTIFEPKTAPRAALYRYAYGRLDRIAGDITNSNGLAWSPDGRTMYWADTQAHLMRAFDFDLDDGSLSRPRVFLRFPTRCDLTNPADYGGRPDGAAVDADGNYWVAMYEGQRLMRVAPDGAVIDRIVLPVRCPTMPCFGGDDLRTLFVTTARANRGVEELAAQPLAGRVLACRVELPGLPVDFAQAQ